MGGWDVNCAFCCGPFGIYDPFGAEDDGYDRSVISSEELEWLDAVRVFGFNPASFASDKCFITGVGNGQEYVLFPIYTKIQFC
ncbi:hypothetical protein M7I_5921 [Glarea lozoyensis 74030]|uniref:Uncharacterized protein n=1 Tax=Glarea lozoyensis (strain ATCC 74030 / MF5533) TaxID=1104152 RepID=H0ET66_GLAL7|nr:hypothetical protein M7I_5921 [Glarea lozoyensis 74030]